MERRLAAMLGIDVVGYSRLMGQDEAGTLSMLTSLRVDLLEPEIGQRHGRVVKLMGGGLLAEFGSLVHAVECAVAIRNEMVRRSASDPDDRRIELRIGVNLGDVIVEGDDLFSDGVNVASRLEGLAEPGSVRLARAARDQVLHKVAVAFDDLSEHAFKNIAGPVPSYRIGCYFAVPQWA